MKKYAVLIFTISMLLFSVKTKAQYTTQHHIAPSPWQYWSDANEIVITTLSPGIVNATISKSDGTEIITLALTATLPAVYRFEGIPMQTPRNQINTIYNDRGIIVTSTSEIAVNVRNIASDDANTGTDDNGNFIKGNASLVSFGDSGKGNSFWLGYYRNNYTGVSGNAPVYSVLAIEDNTQILLNNVTLTNLNAGQSYLFNAPIGTNLTSNKQVIANAGAYSDAPGGCADGIVTQIIPTQSLGKNYVIVRGNGTPGIQPNYPEQSTIVATQANTIIEISNYTAQGIFLNTTTQTIANAGGSYTFHHGDAQNIYSSSFVEADKPVIIYSGSADLCEVDMSTVIPVGDCTGSNEIITRKFTAYNGNDLDAFGYIIVASATEPVLFNGINLETTTGNPRTAIGNSGYYILRFTSAEVGNPENYHITSNAKMTVSIVQQGNGFTMSGFFSSFNETITAPEILSAQNCQTTITTESGLAPYQWYLNGSPIDGATSQNLTVTYSGNYTVTGTLDCGITSQSSPLFVTVCSDLSVTKTIENTSNTGNITFIIKGKNLGEYQDTNVQITDILPNGYSFVAASAEVGTYNNTTGIWNIGTLNVNQEVTLQVLAQVNGSGNTTNIATISGANLDENQANNSAEITPDWNMTLTKIAQQATYHNLGEVIVYNLVLTNTGNVNIYNISTVDANADAGSVSPSFIATLEVGQSITITANHTITEADVLAGEVINQATSVGESFTDIFVRADSDDPTTAAIEDPTITPIVSEADLVTIKTDNQEYYIPGNDLVYTITVTNNGPSDAEDVIIQDNLPDGISVMNWTSSLGTSGSGSLLETVSNLPNNETIIYTVTISVPENYTGNLINTAVVSGATLDPNPACEQCTDIDFQYVPQADLITVKTNNQDYYVSGTTTVYTITVTNNGPDDAENVLIEDLIPSGISVMNWTSNFGTSGSGSLSENIGQLANGETVIYTVTISIPENYTGNLVNTASVSSDTLDPNPTCEQCTDIDEQCQSPNPDCTEYNYVIPKGISPNNDGKNDFFDLSELPPISKLQIFNRYGLKVYEQGNYSSQFNGKSDKGDELPSGTYYYVIHFQNESPKTGWVYINREI